MTNSNQYGLVAADQLQRTIVLHGDGMDMDILMEASKARERVAGDTEWAEFDSNLYWPIFYNNYYPT